MTTDTQTTIKSQEDVGYETTKFALGVGIFMAALVGLWGTVCILSALTNGGPLNVLKSYLTAIIG
ncbi:MAG: hypothetical protein KKD01_08140 [Proteobacteria bacterium]|nr:hypothetical protein [Pseudomonadota bacterium]MBU1233788.1 hypothetical protein [Pseudomonadota bacterium]MBU1416974.1 hypothetical protein [Pseudomonadota bacterium]MBU1454685.1 hypothetical protein [Pseudomonadota bacterium]